MCQEGGTFPLTVHHITDKICTKSAKTIITIRLSIFLTLARACDKRFSADHDTMFYHTSQYLFNISVSVW